MTAKTESQALDKIAYTCKIHEMHDADSKTKLAKAFKRQQ